MLPKIFNAAWVDLWAFGDVGHEDLHLDDVLGPGAGGFQGLVHRGNRVVELRDHVVRDAAIRRLADDAGDPNMGTGAGDVAVVADRPRQAWDDDALDVCHGFCSWAT